MNYTVKNILIGETEEHFWKINSMENSIFIDYDWHIYFSSKLCAECIYYGLFEGDEMIAIQPAFVINKLGVDVWHNCFSFYNNSDDFKYEKECFSNHMESEILPYMLITAPFAYVNEIISSRVLNNVELNFFIENMLKLSEQRGMKFCVFMWQEDNNEVKTNIFKDNNMLENFIGCNHYLDINNMDTFESYFKF